MDGVDVWASTLAQLMAKRRPQDTWELVPEENLASGLMEGGGFQYRLRGLSRLQCGRCQWGWSSAHVHILFHTHLDEDSHLGLVKMRIWGQQCRLCPPDVRGDCQVSLLNVRLFLNKLVLFILQKCYGESLSADQCPEICFGERCEACDLGVCFFQKPPDPAWGPEVRSTPIIKGRYTLYGGEDVAPPAAGKQLLTLGSGPVVDRARAYTPNSITIPLSVSDFIRNPISDSSNFFGQDDNIVTVPFSLVPVRRDQGRDGPGSGPGGPLIVGKGSIYLPACSASPSKRKGLLVNIKCPILHGRGLLLSSIKPFELKGFIFKGRGCIPSATGSPVRPVSYIIGLTDDGEGSITFPSFLADLIRDNSLPDIDGCVTFPFIFAGEDKGNNAPANTTQSKEEEDGHDGPVPAGHEPLPGTHAGRPVTVSEGSITIPFSVFNLIRYKGSGSIAGGRRSSGLAMHGYDMKRRQPQAGLSRSGSEPSWEEDFCWDDDCCAPRFDPYEEVWIWVSMTICMLWIVYLYKFSP